MTKHISIVNAKSVALSAVFLFANLSILIAIIMAIPAVPVCIVPALVMALVCLINFSITNSTANNGIDLQDGMVLLQENENQKRSTFHRNDLNGITLEDMGRNEILETQEKYRHVTIVFHLKSGRKKRYYAVTLTQKQLDKVKNELL